ncbi:hypothetical protein [[Erwinia] mediterraneensis]|uniref:hypothetical protein n=1 Tax=[Erwinia] mediterraneensis TaxID=2161819 RepID=UPI0013EF0284|nr:hypothetical protein [[Erwinia] mediterraneensis]
MQHDEDAFIALMEGMLGDLADPMTYEQAAMDAIADYRTEQQQNRIDWCAHN